MQYRTYFAPALIAFLFLLISVSSCRKDPGYVNGQGDGSDTLAVTDTLAPNLPAQDSSDMEKRLGERQDPDFPVNMPLLNNLLQDSTQRKTLGNFAMEVMSPQRKDLTEQSILAILRKRDEQIIPMLQPRIEKMDEELFFQQADRLADELKLLGIRLVTAEGMFIGLAQRELMPEEVRAVGSPVFQLYVDFINAKAESLGGEYPFLNQASRKDMVLLGEKMVTAFPDNAYTKEILPDFREALSEFTDIHLVRDGGMESPMLGEAHTTYYPYATELEAHREFLAENKDSRFYPVVQKLLNNMSTIGATPESVYVILIEWKTTREKALENVYNRLMKGEDVPHVLTIRRPNGKDEFAIAYRFYEDGEKAAAVFESAEKTFPGAKLIINSFREGQLIQMGF